MRGASFIDPPPCPSPRRGRVARRPVRLRLFSFAALASSIFGPTPDLEAGRRALTTGWWLQSSAKVGENGEVLSRPGFKTEGWHATSVPNTVVAALVQSGHFPDPYFGMNLRSIPGTTYPIGERFTLMPTPADSPFHPSWWYRTEFEVPLSQTGRSFALHFDGINYRANVWFNGVRVAGSDEVVGAFRRHELDVSRLIRPGEANALAVEVVIPEPHDLAFMWVDWNPTPPDKNMGLWGDVYLTDSGPLVLRNPHVITRLALPSLESARLTVTTEVGNTTDRPVRGVVRGAIETVQFAKAVALGPKERLTLRFTPDEAPPLVAVPTRPSGPLHPGPRRGRGGRNLRRKGGPLRRPSSRIGAHEGGPPAVQGERPTHPDPRGRLGLRHAAAAGHDRAPRGRAALHPRDGAQHH